MTALNALIVGLSGTVLNEAERTFLRAARPCGVILFARNLESHDQIRALVSSAKDAIGSGRVLVLIDQEGGRVQRLRPPLGRALPPAARYASLYQVEPERALEAAELAAHLVAHDLRALGINTNCAPVLDVPVPGAHDIIGDRAYGQTVDQIVALGRAVANGFKAGGVVPVIKHIPGHGRALADSHLDLPVVTTSHSELSATDFATFRALRDMPAAMTAHVVFSALDNTAPASTSAHMTSQVIRSEIGFDGFLMSDDLSMKALSGPMRSRAEAVIAAGSDVALHCNGNLEEMQAAAAGVPALAGAALRRFSAALSILESHDELDLEQAAALVARLATKTQSASESV